jgi:hypothetical protein
MAEVFLPPQQFGVNLGEFLQLLLESAVVLDGVLSRLALGRGSQEEFVDLAHRQALGQVIEGAVFISTVVALAVGFAAFILIRFQDETNSGRVSAWQDHVELIHSL